MAAADSRIADLKRVDNLVSLCSDLAFAVVDMFFQIFKVRTVPSFFLVKLVNDSFAQCFLADILCDIAGRKKRTVLVAVDFFEYQSQNRRVDKRFALMTNKTFVGIAFGTEIVGVQKLK